MQFKVRALAVAAVAAVFGVALPAAANATTLVGSGSVAAQPVFEALFDKYEKLHKDIDFVYTANGGNVGVQDVQAGRSQFAGQARSPLPSDAGTTLHQDVPGRRSACSCTRAIRLERIEIPMLADIYHGITTNWSEVPGSNLDTRPSTRSVVTPTEASTTSSSRRCSTTSRTRRTSTRSPPTVWSSTRSSETRRRSATRATPGVARASRRSRSTAFRAPPKQIKNFKYPLSRYIFVVLPTDEPEQGRDQVDRLGPDEQGRPAR